SAPTRRSSDLRSAARHALGRELLRRGRSESYEIELVCLRDVEIGANATFVAHREVRALALLAQEVVDRLERRACHAVKDDLVNVFAEARVSVAIRLELPLFTRIPREHSPFDVAPIDGHELLAGCRDDEPTDRVGARGHRLVTPDRRRITAL